MIRYLVSQTTAVIKNIHLSFLFLEIAFPPQSLEPLRSEENVSKRERKISCSLLKISASLRLERRTSHLKFVQKWFFILAKSIRWLVVIIAPFRTSSSLIWCTHRNERNPLRFPTFFRPLILFIVVFKAQPARTHKSANSFFLLRPRHNIWTAPFSTVHPFRCRIPLALASDAIRLYCKNDKVWVPE